MNPDKKITSKNKTNNIKKRTLFVIFSFVTLAVFLELCLSLSRFSFNPPFFKEDIPFINRDSVKREGIYQFDLYLFWKYRPNCDKYINSMGFRDKEFPEEKQRRYRLFVLGDSCAAGHQLPPEKTYCSYLEKLLNRKNMDYEVINAGVPGYTSFQGLRYSRIIMKKYDPDLIIVCYGVNDRTKARYQDKELSFFRLMGLSFVRFLGKYSKTAQFLMKHTCDIDSIRWVRRVNPSDYNRNLELIAEEADRKNIEVIFIKPCLRSELEQGRRSLSYKPPGPYIDLFESFSLYKEEQAGEVFYDSKHFTEKGHKIIAKEIYKSKCK